ncbi:RNA polymerase sigma factor [Armatimonas rosea]|uniref:RNA polymerase sigma-70 factor (ECF subfamily) n=1 Tax=Armatimonas rosea TaxID=685828 RepID=A0A7W9SLN6_ARMRO|nr:RNA polymerase sigma factor [Armatimonas rosea]MBB6048942.1 RNA polymerase sigma-70 factor (ECF subfamily) [Armatimonas rosea]
MLSQPVEQSESQARCERAFARLWEVERPRLWRLAVRVAGSVDAADDLVQEVGLRAAQAFPSLRRLESGPAWLTKLTVHTALRWRQRRRELELLDSTLLSPERGPEEQTLQRDSAARTRAAIDTLPETLRTPLILQYWEGLSCREIAETLELPLGTLLSRLFAARKRLRKELHDELL